MAVYFKTFSHAQEIDSKIWNQLAERASPTMEWEYFNALETSGAVSEARGYRASHLMAFSEDHKPIALAPLYERDRAWVEFGDGGLIEFLTELTGLPYNHGLVGIIPFTPSPGYEFLHLPEVDSEAIGKLLLNYIDFLCERRGLSTSRIYFVSPTAPRTHLLLQQHGYVGLRTNYFYWRNRGYQTFDDYLGSFKSSRRTKIKREIRDVREQGIDIRMVEGADAPESFYDEIYDLYRLTWEKHMGREVTPFLNASFFKMLGASFRERTAFSVASTREGNVGMAIFYKKLRNIYGRYWGCYEERPFLHFATCYYHPIDYAIQHGFELMDPGFGGDHKLIRGYEVVPIFHYVKFHGEQQRRIAHSVLSQIGVQQTEMSKKS